MGPADLGAGVRAGRRGRAVNFEQRLTIAAPRDVLWDAIMDVPQVAQCLPGVTKVEHVEGDKYRGTMNVQVGPIRLALEGTIAIEHQERDQWRASLRAEAAERRVGGGVNSTVQLALEERGAAETDLIITTTANFLGRLGEFGQPIIRKKADATLQEFARNLQAKLNTRNTSS